MKKLYFISIFAIFIGLALTHQILGLTIGQIQTYNGTINSINYSEKSFILSSQISAVSKFIAAIWPWSKSNNQAIKVLATDDTKIQIKGTKGYINTNFSALKNNDRVTVKGKITDISLSSYPATIVTALEIKVTYRPIVVVKKTIPKPVTPKSSEPTPQPPTTQPPTPQPPTSSVPLPVSSLNQYHNICKKVEVINIQANNYPLFKCFKVEGAGTDQCQVDADCNPNIPLSATHNECKNQKCIKVMGSGSNHCRIDSDCQILPPNPPLPSGSSSQNENVPPLPPNASSNNNPTNPPLPSLPE